MSAKPGGIAIVDFGLGNLRSVEKALEHLGRPGTITSDGDAIAAAGKILLPGDGAFGAAMANLNDPGPSGRSLSEVLLGCIAAGTPLLGICVGMQVLLDRSEEFGNHDGLGVVPGEVLRFPGGPGLKVPQIGWNELRVERPDCPLLEGVESGSRVYFIHSFYCAPRERDAVAATTVHGIPYASALRQGNVYATQFHPEKSGDVGLRILSNFLNL